MTASLISAIPAKEIALANLQMLFHSDPSHFFSQHIAMGMSYLVITMLYFPCSATLATMKKESSWKIVGLHIGTSLGIAYVTGIIVY
jgi:ferrous iron transport protein B